MPDYERKAKVISSGLVIQAKKIRRAISGYTWTCLTGEIVHTELDYWTAVEMRSFLRSTQPEDFHEAELVADANKHQIGRLRKRIQKMLTTSNDCVFLTLTFRDDVLDKTSSETRRQYVRKWLKDVSTEYVANIDFGAKNGREHYHAVSNAHVDPTTWLYGACNVQAVRYNPESKSCVKLAKYVSKLTNHAIKETTKRCALIYSR